MTESHRTFKARLANTSERMTAHICTIPSATVTQAMAAAGSDAVIIDLEHGAVDYGSAHAMIAATQGYACAPLCASRKTMRPMAKGCLTSVPRASSFR